VVFGRGPRVLLVHRPKYDDWSFPKGKADRGEHVTAAAVREVMEETGVHVRLGVPLDPQHYPVARGRKTVHYWVARPVGEHDVSSYRPNAEVDRVEWVDVDSAADRLSYAHDVDTLAAAVERRRKTRTLVVARHGGARSRSAWRGDDRSRPLLRTGAAQAEKLVAILAAYDARFLLSSSSTRCVQTLQPYAEATGRRLRTDVRLSEEEHTPPRVRRVVEGVLERLAERPAKAGAAVLCSHRPVLPEVFACVGVPDPHLAAGEALVVHLRAGEVVATERHRTAPVRG
jgi:8-oxo-dGTP diphosphatase